MIEGALVRSLTRKCRLIYPISPFLRDQCDDYDREMRIVPTRRGILSKVSTWSSLQHPNRISPSREESELQGLSYWATIEKFLLRFKSILLTKAIVRLGNEVHLVRKPFGSSRVPRSQNTVSPG